MKKIFQKSNEFCEFEDNEFEEEIVEEYESSEIEDESRDIELEKDNEREESEIGE